MLDASAALVRHIKTKLIHLNKADLPDEYCYQSLPLCVIDAVFSIGVRYESTRRTVRSWCQSQVPAWQMISRVPGSDLRRSQHTIRDFLTLTESRSFDTLAQTAFDNRQRTSPRNGILKAEAVYKFAVVLNNFGIDDFCDTVDQARNEKVRSHVMQIKGQRSGLSFDYFQMLSGSDQHVKADRMVRRFVADALGTSNVPADMAQKLVLQVCQRLKVEFPRLTPRLLDYEIWKCQRSLEPGRVPCLVGDRIEDVWCGLPKA